MMARRVMARNIRRDPYWNSVVLLLHGHGNDGSTAIVDSSKYANAISAHGNVKIVADQSAINGSSIFFDGSSYLSTPVSSLFDFKNSDFTIEAFYTPISKISTYPCIIGNDEFWGPECMNIADRHGNSPHQFSWHAYNCGGSPAIASNISVQNLVRYHIAVVRSGNIFLMFCNGTLAGQKYSTQMITNSSHSMHIGRDNYEGNYIHGRIDELRITNGVARYISDFNLPSAPFPNR